MESTATGFVGSGIKQIPEVRHHENGEEKRAFVGAQSVAFLPRNIQKIRERSNFCIFKNDQQNQLDKEEQSANSEDVGFH